MLTLSVGASDEEVLFKEAVYNALALGSVVAHEYLPLRSLLQQLEADLANTDPRYKVVRRQIAHLFESWGHHNRAERTAIYRILIRFATLPGCHVRCPQIALIAS
jgi:hypothetical protein